MEQIKRGRGAPAGNSNAKKDETAESCLQVRCTSSDKAGWVKAARAAGGLKLSVWVVKALNEKSNPPADRSAADGCPVE